MPKKRSFKWSLQTRILALTVMISVSVLAVTDWLATLSAVRAVESAALAQTAQTARRLASSLERSPAARLSPESQREIREVLELIPSVVRVDIYAQFDGRLKLVDSSSMRGDRALEGKEMAVFHSRKPDTFTIEEESARYVFSVHPLRFRDGWPGFLTVITSLQAVDEIEAAHARIRLYSMVATMILLVAAISLLFRTTVYRSTRHLVHVMQRFRREEASVRANEGLPGEFGALARHLNHMIEELSRFNERLRQEIDTATDQLARQNRELQQLNLQLVETQKRLTQAERLALAGQLTGTFAHEVGSPLSAVSTHLQMLLEDAQLEERVRDRLRLASDQIDRVCTIVESLLATTRQSRRRAPVHLQEIIGKVAQLLGPTLEARHVRFELKDSHGACLIEGDPDQLEQLFLNLFNNSLDAIQGSGALSVDVRRASTDGKGASGFLRIDVRDSGVGIAPEKLDHIFDPFFTTKELNKGTGLGLAICKEIVRQHGGRISVVSEVGQGACFRILLPEAKKVE